MTSLLFTAGEISEVAQEICLFTAAGILMLHYFKKGNELFTGQQYSYANSTVFLYASILPAISFVYFLITEQFTGVGSDYEKYAWMNRAFGPYWWAWWMQVGTNVILPQIFWIKKIRRQIIISLLVMMLTVAGMNVERMIILLTSTHRDYLVATPVTLYPTGQECLITIALLIAYWYLLRRRVVK